MKALIGLSYAEGTYKKYVTALASLQKFLAWKYRVSEIALDKLDHQFLTEYEFYLKTVGKQQKDVIVIIIKKGILDKRTTFNSFTRIITPSNVGFCLKAVRKKQTMTCKYSFVLYFVALSLMTSCNSNSSTAPPNVGTYTVKKQDTLIKLQPQLIKDSAVVPDIEGLYIATPNEGSDEEVCNIRLKITRFKNGFVYQLSIQDSIINGNIKIAPREDSGEDGTMVTLEGIKWASYEGDISQQDDNSNSTAPELPIPVGIDMLYQDNAFTFQNYGNSMNAYTVIEQCGQKYIRLVKQK